MRITCISTVVGVVCSTFKMRTLDVNLRYKSYMPTFVFWFFWFCQLAATAMNGGDESLFRQGGKILNDFWRCDLGESQYILFPDIFQTLQS